MRKSTGSDSQIVVALHEVEVGSCRRRAEAIVEPTRRGLPPLPSMPGSGPGAPDRPASAPWSSPSSTTTASVSDRFPRRRQTHHLDQPKQAGRYRPVDGFTAAAMTSADWVLMIAVISR
jgi:hypothetical protein